MTALPPAKRPCGTCPYRCDVPSGVWAPEEYAKLPKYDAPTGEQPPALFLCHQQDGHACAGWVAVHDMRENLALRLAAVMGMADAVVDAFIAYVTDVPLWPTGTAAFVHGMRGVATPDARARRAIDRLERKRG